MLGTVRVGSEVVRGDQLDKWGKEGTRRISMLVRKENVLEKNFSPCFFSISFNQ